MAKHTMQLKHVRDENDEPVEVPARWEICERCNGEGKHDHPAFSNGISEETWREWDYEDREDYYNGAYDVACTECRGAGKVLVPDVYDADGNVLPKYAESMNEEEDTQYEIDRNKYIDACVRRAECGYAW